MMMNFSQKCQNMSMNWYDIKMLKTCSRNCRYEQKHTKHVIDDVFAEKYQTCQGTGIFA